MDPDFQSMREIELVDFIRDTVVRLNSLASRLENLNDEGRNDGAKSDNRTSG